MPTTTSPSPQFTSLRGLARLWGVAPASIWRWFPLGLPTLQPFGRTGRHIINIEKANAWLEARSAAAANGAPIDIEVSKAPPFTSRTKLRRRVRSVNKTTPVKK